MATNMSAKGFMVQAQGLQLFTSLIFAIKEGMKGKLLAYFRKS